MVNMVVLIGNWGFYVKLYLVKCIVFEDKFVIVFDNFVERVELEINKMYFEIVIDGMVRVVISGIVISVYILDIVVCGKIGIVENN